MDYLTTHTSLSSIRCGFAPGFVNYKKGCSQLAAAGDKVYQLLAHGRWFSSGTPDFFQPKAVCHGIAEILLKVALNTKNQIKSNHLAFGSYIPQFKQAVGSRDIVIICVCSSIHTPFFSSPGHRPCELLSWVRVRRPSVSFSHLNLLL